MLPVVHSASLFFYLLGVCGFIATFIFNLVCSYWGVGIEEFQGIEQLAPRIQYLEAGLNEFMWQSLWDVAVTSVASGSMKGQGEAACSGFEKIPEFQLSNWHTWRFFGLGVSKEISGGAVKWGIGVMATVG